MVSTGTRVSSKNGTLSASPTSSFCCTRRVYSDTVRSLAVVAGLSPELIAAKGSCWAFSRTDSRSLLLPKTWRSNHARRCSSVSIRFAWERTTSNHCAGVRLFISASPGTVVLVVLDIPTSYRRLGVGIALFLQLQSIPLAPLPRLDPLQQQLQCCPVHLPCTHLSPVSDKPARLETLRPDAKSGA